MFGRHIGSAAMSAGTQAMTPCLDGVRVNSISTGTQRARLYTPSQQYGEVAVRAVDLVGRRRPSEPICF
jgi:hypothetical protein